jgi:FlaA1/EpsC-like NDP-sugar epimerase
MKLNLRVLAAFAHDLVACALAWFAAFALRFNLDIPPGFLKVAVQSLPWVVVADGVVFWVFGLYRGIWRYASLPDLKRILFAVAVGAAVITMLLFMLRMGVPRSVPVLHPLLLVLVMGGSRFAYRAWKEQRVLAPADAAREPVFVIGSGEAAVTLLKDLERSPQWRVRGVFDDNRARHGRQIQGITVLGGLAELPERTEALGVQLAIIAMPEATHGARRRVVETCREAGLRVMTVPSFDDLVSGRVTVSQIRHVELDDLLGRDPVSLDMAGLKEWLAGRRVLVTGAGGSIGSELCRQLARFQPARLVLFESNEYVLYTLEQEFQRRFPEVAIRCVIGDVRDAARVDEVLAAERPSVVFHAAAYKHVPLMEDDNAWQAVVNNVTGTLTVGRAAIAHGVEKFVMISTDKAVNPVNVMGASKRLAELVCQALQQAEGTRFVSVRFGNVLGSTGSVIPKFREQIAAGGPVTVTHPEITRYFMSIPEAAQLVLQAGLMGSGGQIFVLDMGEPVKIADLARDLIRLSGFGENEIRITFTGLRPGEKLYEEPLAADENLLPTPHPKLYIARAKGEDAQWLAALEAWLNGTPPATGAEVRAALARWVPEYRPQ